MILPPSSELHRLELRHDRIEGTLDLRRYKALRWLLADDNPDLEKVILPAGLQLEELRTDSHTVVEYSSL